jgi:hypothetical protein
MRRVSLTCILIAALPLAAQAGTAPPPAPAPVVIGSVDHDDCFGGLQWTWQQGAVPDLVIGCRHVKVDAGGDAEGYGASISLNFKKGFDKVRVEGVKGDRSAQGLLGGGYSIVNKDFFLGAGIQGPFVFGGVDYLLKNKRWEPYIGVNSIDKYDLPVGIVRRGGGGTPVDGGGDTPPPETDLPAQF